MTQAKLIERDAASHLKSNTTHPNNCKALLLPSVSAGTWHQTGKVLYIQTRRGARSWHKQTRLAINSAHTKRTRPPPARDHGAQLIARPPFLASGPAPHPM